MCIVILRSGVVCQPKLKLTQGHYYQQKKETQWLMKCLSRCCFMFYLLGFECGILKSRQQSHFARRWLRTSVLSGWSTSSMLSGWSTSSELSGWSISWRSFEERSPKLFSQPTHGIWIQDTRLLWGNSSSCTLSVKGRTDTPDCKCRSIEFSGTIPISP